MLVKKKEQKKSNLIKIIYINYLQRVRVIVKVKKNEYLMKTKYKVLTQAKVTLSEKYTLFINDPYP